MSLSSFIRALYLAFAAGSLSLRITGPKALLNISFTSCSVNPGFFTKAFTSVIALLYSDFHLGSFSSKSASPERIASFLLNAVTKVIRSASLNCLYSFFVASKYFSNNNKSLSSIISLRLSKSSGSIETTGALDDAGGAGGAVLALMYLSNSVFTISGTSAFFIAFVVPSGFSV